MGKDTLTMDLFADIATKPATHIPEYPTVQVGTPTRQELEADHDAFIAEIIVSEQANDEICKEWRACIWGSACMDDKTVNPECVCFKDEPQKLTPSAFSRDERKILAAGFDLVKYFRDRKVVLMSEADPANLWTALEPFPTYAAAERKLKELKAQGNIETGLDGKIIMSGWNRPGSLIDAGFEFYRVYGLRDFDQEGFSIRAGSKNWSICQRATSKEELQTAWNMLMQTEKALEG